MTCEFSEIEEIQHTCNTMIDTYKMETIMQ